MLSWMTGSTWNGLFAYLAKRYEQKAHTDRARIWQSHTIELANLLRDGTEYEETTPDGSVKIRTPSAQATRISVTMEHQQSGLHLCEPPIVEAQHAKALSQGDTPEDSPPANNPSSDANN
jgi:hypothetical protein